MLDAFVAAEGEPEVVMFSGDQPTIHHDILAMIDLAQARPINVVNLNTNGIRLASDRRFVAELGRRNRPGRRVNVYLQLDGLDAATHLAIRGRDLREIKQRALDNCAEVGLTVTLVAAIERYLSEHEIGPVIRTGLAHQRRPGRGLRPHRPGTRRRPHRRPQRCPGLRPHHGREVMRPRRALAATAAGLGLAAAAAGGYIGLVTGRLTLDLGVGRRTRPLGPLAVDIAAPREVAFEAAAAPYAERRPRALQEKVRIIDRGEDMVLAAHYTPVGRRLTAVTVESVTLDPPNRMGFRLLRGPVPHVVESFDFAATPEGTRLTYTGELGTDLGRAGQLWGNLVARSWEGAVRASLATIKAEAERRAR